MIILVEGPDGSGKTTLCNLFKAGGFEYIHLSKEKNVNLLYKNLINYLQAHKDSNIVIDRAYISNIIYNNVFGDGDYISLNNLAEIHKLIDCIILTIPQNKDQYLKHFDSLKNVREEVYTTMGEIYDSYKSKNSYKFLLQDKPYVEYDMFSDLPGKLYEFIIQGEVDNEN